MPGKGKQFGKDGHKGGRPKGSKNKFTTIKDAVLEVFERKGGAEGLLTWANKPQNEAKFYDIAAKLLPKTVEADIKGGPFTIILGGEYESGEDKGRE